jgi:putative hemolysin
LSGQGDTPVASRQELEHLVNTSGVVLTADEKRLIINGLHFSQKTVESIMTPRGVVETVKKSDVLGPLMLDELHKTGHSRFPVIDGDIDHVVGMLHIKDLLTLGRKDTETAEQAMEKRVFYINQEQTLEHALAAFIKTRHHLFIVVNGYRETAGILTLEDVMEALLGREIVDEFDVHDDLRVVAARSAKGNNNPPHATNV